MATSALIYIKTESSTLILPRNKRTKWLQSTMDSVRLRIYVNLNLKTLVVPDIGGISIV